MIGGMDDDGLGYVTVNKEDLLAKLIENMKAHAEAHAEAMAEYEKVMIREAQKLLRRVRKKDFSKLALNLPCPISYERDYNRVIKMLEMSVETQIKISGEQFRQYVLDEWAWKEKVAATNSFYGRTGKR